MKLSEALSSLDPVKAHSVCPLLMQLSDLAFDDAGNPCWDLPVPLRPSVSSFGHPLPYVHPGIGIVRPKPWLRSNTMRLALAFGILMPLYIATALGISAINFRRSPVSVTWVSGWLQRVGYWCITRWSDGPTSEPVQVAMMMPNGSRPVPIDVGIIEPVLVLYSMGIATTFCCEGHSDGDVPYISIGANQEFPLSLLRALDRAWLPYELNRYGDRSLVLYDRGEDFRFAAVLRAWAREQAIHGACDARKTVDVAESGSRELIRSEKAVSVDKIMAKSMVVAAMFPPVTY